MSDKICGSCSAHLAQAMSYQKQNDALKAENEKFRKALEIYADKENWETDHVCDSWSGGVGCVFNTNKFNDHNEDLVAPDIAKEALAQGKEE